MLSQQVKTRIRFNQAKRQARGKAIRILGEVKLIGHVSRNRTCYLAHKKVVLKACHHLPEPYVEIVSNGADDAELIQVGINLVDAHQQ